MKTINEIELENKVAALENKIFHVKQALSKNIDLLKKHHKSHLEMVKENPNSDYFKGLASDSKFQIELAEMNEHHILQILLYF
jgi:hypothetical protein